MPDVPSLPDFSALSATAVLAWYAWHTASHTLPELVRAFRDEMASLRGDCAAEREALHADLAAERERRHADHALLADAIRELAARLPQA
ncbi:MAG: hypothetical protein QM775_35000 [Pirellulales bacterium]